MFERIIVHQHNPLSPESPIDVGQLVEAMLFYDKTRLVAGSHVIKQLATTWTPEGLIELIANGHLAVTYNENFGAIFSDRAPSGQERHSVIVGSLRTAGGTLLGADYSLPRVFKELTGKVGKGRRLAGRLLDVIDVAQLDDTLADKARLDLLDPRFVEGAVSRLLEVLIPQYWSRNPIGFQVYSRDGFLHVNTQIDFARANAEYHRRIPPSHSTLTPALLLSHILTSREMLDAAAQSNSDLATDLPHSGILALRFSCALDRYARSSDEQAKFQDFALEDARAIREAVNSGSRSIDDVLKLLERARRFKQWLSGLRPEHDIIKEYHREAVATTWAERLPTKSLRWLLFTGAGLALDIAGGPGVGTAMGVGASALDAFLVDRYLKGWKPSQFVQRDLVPFVKRVNGDAARK